MSRKLASRIGIASALLALLVVAPGALAGKGNGKGALNGKGPSAGVTITLDPDGSFSFGDTVYVTTDAPLYPDNAGPWISLQCFQNGVRVGTADHAGFPGGWYYGEPFHLGPSMTWTSGAADCTVTVFHLENSRMVVDATTSFNVGA